MNSTLNLLSLAVTAGSFCVLVSSADAVETRTILQTYCLNCHSTEKHKGDLDLKASDIHQAPHVWENVLDQMQLGDMPPKKEKQPAE